MLGFIHHAQTPVQIDANEIKRRNEEFRKQNPLWQWKFFGYDHYDRPVMETYTEYIYAGISIVGVSTAQRELTAIEIMQLGQGILQRED